MFFLANGENFNSYLISFLIWSLLVHPFTTHKYSIAANLGLDPFPLQPFLQVIGAILLNLVPVTLHHIIRQNSHFLIRF